MIYQLHLGSNKSRRRTLISIKPDTRSRTLRRGGADAALFNSFLLSGSWVGALRSLGFSFAEQAGGSRHRRCTAAGRANAAVGVRNIVGFMFERDEEVMASKDVPPFAWKSVDRPRLHGQQRFELQLRHGCNPATLHCVIEKLRTSAKRVSGTYLLLRTQ